MKTAIIVHGKPSKEEYFNPQSASQSNRHWLPWIQKQLILNGVLAQTPEMPEPYQPDYQKYCELFERFPINEETMLIGHSCGGGFLVRWLSEHKVGVGKVVLVAPWLDPEGELKSDFFKFNIDSDIASRTKELHLVYSNDDYPDVLATIEILKSKFPGLQITELTGKGHLTYAGMKTEEFPELRDIVLS